MDLSGPEVLEDNIGQPCTHHTQRRLQEIDGRLYIMHHLKATRMYTGKKISAAVLGTKSVPVVDEYNTTKAICKDFKKTFIVLQ